MGRGKNKGKRKSSENLMDKEVLLLDKEKAKAEETKKAIWTLSKAASKIDRSALEAFLEEEKAMPNTGLYGLYFYFEKVFPQVSSQWLNVFKESPWSEVPLSHIPIRVQEISRDWIQQLRTDNTTYCDFAMWALDRILIDWEAREKDTSSKTQMALVVTLAMVLRSKPETLMTMLPMLRGRPRYQGEDKLPVMVWMSAQAFRWDLDSGLYSWTRNLLPLVDNNKGHSSESVNLILRFVERILYCPEARKLIVKKADWKGERLVPPCSFEMLLRLTFPASSARVEATNRFKKIYRLLKEVALAPGSKAVTKEIFTFSLKLAGEGNLVVAKEAIAIAIFCVTENVDCFKKWDIMYKENIEASVGLLRKLAYEWEEHSIKLLSSPSDTLTVNDTIYNLTIKNEKAISEGVANCVLYKEADKYCKHISGRLSPGSGSSLEITLFTTMVIAVAAALVGATVTLLNIL